MHLTLLISLCWAILIHAKPIQVDLAHHTMLKKTITAQSSQVFIFTNLQKDTINKCDIKGLVHVHEMIFPFKLKAPKKALSTFKNKKAFILNSKSLLASEYDYADLLVRIDNQATKPTIVSIHCTTNFPHAKSISKDFDKIYPPKIVLENPPIQTLDRSSSEVKKLLKATLQKPFNADAASVYLGVNKGNKLDPDKFRKGLHKPLLSTYLPSHYIKDDQADVKQIYNSIKYAEKIIDCHLLLKS